MAMCLDKSSCTIQHRVHNTKDVLFTRHNREGLEELLALQPLSFSVASAVLLSGPLLLRSRFAVDKIFPR
jgi:hypothetical protein